MNEVEDLKARLAPLTDAVRTLDLRDPAAAEAALEARFPYHGDAVQQIGRLLRQGVAARRLAERENGPVRFGRLQKGAPGTVSIDVVHMATPALGHTHPQGEVDLCFAVSGAPRFDGRAPGFIVYAPGTWHVPTVDGGAMDILYFLPEGSIVFDAVKPA